MRVLEARLSSRALLWIAAALVALWVLTRVWQVLLLVVVALIFMTALLPYVNWLARHGLSRLAAVLVVMFGIIAALAGLLFLVIPPLADQLLAIKDELPADARKLSDLLADVGLEVDLEEPARNIKWDALLSGSSALDIGQRVLLGLIALVTVVVLTAYLLLDAPRLTAFIYQFVPPGREPTVERVLIALGVVVGGYVRGQAITSLLAGLFTLIMCLVLGVPNAVAFGVITFFADMIPIVGVFISTIPPVHAAFQDSEVDALILLGALVLYQQLEDRVIVPRVYGHTLNLPPLIVVVAVLVGGQLLGIAGVLLALPGAAALRVALDFWRERGSLTLMPPVPASDPLAPDPGGLHSGGGSNG
jgi:predicted PurR-regulated permease PerM